MTSLESKLPTLVEFLEDEKILYKTDEVMRKYSTILIGNAANVVVFPKSAEEFISLSRFLKAERLNSFVFSGGSNTLFAFEKTDSVLISTKNLRGLEISEDKITAYSGERLGDLIKATANCGLSGLEYFVGVPAALGGALKMNFSCYRAQICDLLESVSVLRKGEEMLINKGELNYSYRNGGFEKDDVILSATLKLKELAVKEVSKKKAECYTKRAKSQPLSSPSLGCVFKNPQFLSVGKLIDELGLKGTKVGGAMISQKHGAFIVNVGGATANDILNLIDKIKEIVYNEIKQELQTEIVIVK